jgi:hypothetical protein
MTNETIDSGDEMAFAEAEPTPQVRIQYNAAGDGVVTAGLDEAEEKLGMSRDGSKTRIAYALGTNAEAELEVVVPVLDGPWARLPDDFAKVRPSQKTQIDEDSTGNDAVSSRQLPSENRLVEPAATSGGARIVDLDQRQRLPSATASRSRSRAEVAAWAVGGSVFCVISVCLIGSFIFQKKEQREKEGTREPCACLPPNATSLTGAILLEASACRRCIEQKHAKHSMGSGSTLGPHPSEQLIRQGAFLMDTAC